jgi:hypothetical protein
VINVTIVCLWPVRCEEERENEAGFQARKGISKLRVTL